MAEKTEKHSELHTIRDTVESIWVAIVLAFVLRAFMIEAFVIPTGSMAPRLMGEHYTLQCPSCRYEFALGRERSYIGHRANSKEHSVARCPACGYQWEINGSHYRGGDRVLVLKYLYRFSDPRRWDVVVFRNPQDNTQNYIKRLVGLPGEEIEIVHGDIFYRKTGKGQAGPWQIARKPRQAQKAMWQTVFDNDYRIDRDKYAKQFSHQPPPAWEPVDKTKSWDLTADNGRNFIFKGSNRVETIEFKPPDGYFLPHYGYNPPETMGDRSPVHVDLDTDICTDLQLSCTFHPAAADARIYLHLTSFKHHFRASVSASGAVLLERQELGDPAGAWRQWGKSSVAPMKIGMGYAIALEHADMRVTLRIGDDVVLVSKDSDYLSDATEDAHTMMTRRMATASDNPIPTPRVQISATGGNCELRHIRVMRDVFYTCPTLYARKNDPQWIGPQGDYARKLFSQGRQDSDTKTITGQPGWGATGHPIKLLDSDQDDDLDEFYVLGDNSPQSLDSRAWVLAAPTLRLYKDKKPQYKLGTVPRYNMIGKAFFVYWPAGFALPGMSNLPIVPNVGRMRLIR